MAVAQRFATLGVKDLTGRLIGIERDSDGAQEALALASNASEHVQLLRCQQSRRRFRR